MTPKKLYDLYESISILINTNINEINTLNDNSSQMPLLKRQNTTKLWGKKVIEITEKENTVKMNPNQQEKLPRTIEEEFDSMTKNKLKEVAGQLYYQNQQSSSRMPSISAPPPS